MKVVAGVDLGGTAINYTFLDQRGQFLIDGLCEHPARSVEGPGICLSQIADGLAIAAAQAGVRVENVVAIGLDTPGPASAVGVFSKRGSTNFVHAEWAGYDIRAGLERRLDRPVCYLNDGNAAALWGHVAIFGSENTATSVSAIIGTGLGGGLIVDDHIIEGEHSHGAELGHVILETDNGRLCNTGQYGTAEAYVSATALLKRFQEAIDDGAVTSVVGRLEAGEHLTPLLITEEAEQGDHLSLELIMQMARYLGAAITTVVHAIDPAMVLLGGAMTFGRQSTRVGREFLLRVQREFQTRTFPTLAAKTTIDYASLGGDAGFIGAAGCARRAADRNALFFRQ